MARRAVTALLAGVLISGALVGPGLAQEPAPEVPEVVQIEDPAGDANYLNSQGSAGEGDHPTPADVGSVSDILKVWFTNDKTNVSVHVQTEAPPPAVSAYIFRIRVNPGEASASGCQWFEIYLPGAGNTAADPEGSLREVCEEIDPQDGVVTIAEGPEGTGITTLTLPRASHASFAKGGTIVAPNAEVRNFLFAVTAPQIDNTQVGTDYMMVDKKKKKKKK